MREGLVSSEGALMRNKYKTKYIGKIMRKKDESNSCQNDQISNLLAS